MRRLWHQLFGHAWDLTAMLQHSGGETDFIRCKCGAVDRLEHTWPHTA